MGSLTIMLRPNWKVTKSWLAGAARLRLLLSTISLKNNMKMDWSPGVTLCFCSSERCQVSGSTQPTGISLLLSVRGFVNLSGLRGSTKFLSILMIIQFANCSWNTLETVSKPAFTSRILGSKILYGTGSVIRCKQAHSPPKKAPIFSQACEPNPYFFIYPQLYYRASKLWACQTTAYLVRCRVACMGTSDTSQGLSMVKGDPSPSRHFQLEDVNEGNYSESHITFSGVAVICPWISRPS